MTTDQAPRILVVDDEPLNIELMEIYLSDNYRIIPAENGKEGLEKAYDDIDMILLDVMMPDMTGYEVCRILKNDPLTCFIPVIMVTALSAKEEKIKGIEAGADDFLPKPVDRLELETRVRSLLRIRELHGNLLKERDQAQNYLDVAGVILCVFNRQYHVEMMNIKGYDLLDLGERDVLGKDFIQSFIPDEFKDHCIEKFNILLSGRLEGVEYMECPILTSDGSQRLIRWHHSLLKDGTGTVTGILSSGEDITESKRAEMELKQYAQELKRSNDLKDLFIDIIRHDLMNPAGAVKGFTEILLKESWDDRHLTLLRSIQRTNRKLINMIESAAAFAKVESSSQLDIKVLDLHKLINDVLESLDVQIQDRDIAIDDRLEGQYLIRADPMIGEVFLNLVSNAVKYGPEHSMIIIEMEDLGDAWKVSVIDNGPGIADEDKLHVFERFKRVHKGSIKGTGLGLAIVKRIIDMHMGQVVVADNPLGQGCMFQVTLNKETPVKPSV